jgi:hypothetical protein
VCFNLTKTVSILSFRRRNQLFVIYLRYRLLINVAKRFPWSCTHAKSQNLEVLEFYVITALSLAKKAANQL